MLKPSLINGVKQSFLYNCILDVEPGVRYVEKPHNLTYLSVANNLISVINCWVVDQAGRTVDFRQEQLEIELLLVRKRNSIYTL